MFILSFRLLLYEDSVRDKTTIWDKIPPVFPNQEYKLDNTLSFECKGKVFK